VLTQVETERAILDAGRSILLEHGPGALTMRRVGSEAGITAAGIYRHFPNRQALIRAIIAEGFGGLEAEVRRCLTARAPLARLKRMVVACREYALAHPEHSRLMFRERRVDVRVSPTPPQGESSPVFDLLASEVRAAMADGTLRRDEVMEVTLTLWAQIEGLAVLHDTGRFGGDSLLYRRQFDRSVARLFRGLER
jgi:AcrR family transcriptional regulator